MIRIWVRMLRIPFKWFEFAFKRMESRLKCSKWIRMLRTLSNGSNFHSNDSNPFRMIRISITMLETLSNASNPFRMVQIRIRMLRIPFEWFEFGFEFFESLSNVSNLDSNVSNPFKLFEFGFE